MFGSLSGVVVVVGSDSITSTDQKAESNYIIRVELTESNKTSTGKSLELIPGMTAQIDILTGTLEPTNQNYALAKIFGTYLTKSISIQDKLNWRVFVASNLYGPNDHFNSEKSHLLSAIISKAVAAKESQSKYIEMWGDGTPRREFTYVDDFADWILSSSEFLGKLPHVLNLGIGVDYSVHDYYKKVLTELELEIEIISKVTMPNGNRRKLMNSSIAKSYGWNPTTGIEDGLAKTVKWYLNNRSEV